MPSCTHLVQLAVPLVDDQHVAVTGAFTHRAAWRQGRLNRKGCSDTQLFLSRAMAREPSAAPSRPQARPYGVAQAGQAGRGWVPCMPAPWGALCPLTQFKKGDAFHGRARRDGVAELLQGWVGKARCAAVALARPPRPAPAKHGFAEVGGQSLAVPADEGDAVVVALALALQTMQGGHARGWLRCSRLDGRGCTGAAGALTAVWQRA